MERGESLLEEVAWAFGKIKTTENTYISIV
jgi:hypothetical protein